MKNQTDTSCSTEVSPIQSSETPVETISRRSFVKMVTALGCASTLPLNKAFAGTSKSALSKGKPNIVYLFADQMRAHALGCMGNDQIITPHLDKLAKKGLLFSNAISAQPVCTPYRAHLLTGRFGHTTGVVHNDIRLPDNELLLPEVLKKSGYSTGYIGKWHLAGHRDNPVDETNRRGWDLWAVRNCSHNHMKPQYWLNDSKTPVCVDGWEPDVQTDLAVEYIQQNKNNTFALMVSYGPPHNPYNAPQKYVDLYKDKELTERPNCPEHDLERLKQYYAMITSLDDCVGRIVSALTQAGLMENTILCFSSDHGDMLGSQGHRLKQRPWEESINVPFIMSYPEKIKPAKKDHLFSSVDVMPTLLGLSGCPIPKDVQGENLSQLLTGETQTEQEELFLFNTHHGGGPGCDWRAIRTKEWVYAFHCFGDWVMYDLKNDPYQLNNLAKNPAYKKRRDELRQRLDLLRKKYDENLPVEGKMPAPIQLPECGDKKAV